jgi:hypothetical protein
MMTTHSRIPLSPFHSIEIAESLSHLVSQPREKDFSVRTISRKTAPDGRELVRMELVIAGRQTRSAFTRAEQYPLHFLKSYHPWSFHGDPQVEFDNHQVAAEILGIPGPIGCDASSIRASFLPGVPLSRLSPFTDVEPPERCLGIAEETPLPSLIGLWKVAEELFGQLEKLHARGFFHRDMELHNAIVSLAPLQVFLIDFESAERSFRGDEEERNALRFKDLAEVLRLAVYVQSGLGRQQGALAEAAEAALPKLFRNANTFAARLDAADRRTIG